MTSDLTEIGTAIPKSKDVQGGDAARIRVVKRGTVGEIRLNEPRVLGPTGTRGPEDLLAAIAEVRSDPEVRVVLLTGEGESFSSVMNLTGLGRGEIPIRWFHECERVFSSLETLEKPVICGLRGRCLGDGLQVAIACDVRLVAEDTVLGLPAVKEAFIPGMGIFRLPRLIGMGHARHLILSGQSISAEEAYRIGLVNKVVPADRLEGELEAWAQDYSEIARPSIEWSKHLCNIAYDVPFEEFLGEFDLAAEVVSSTEEYRAARQVRRDGKECAQPNDNAHVAAIDATLRSQRPEDV